MFLRLHPGKNCYTLNTGWTKSRITVMSMWNTLFLYYYLLLYYFPYEQLYTYFCPPYSNKPHLSIWVCLNEDTCMNRIQINVGLSFFNYFERKWLSYKNKSHIQKIDKPDISTAMYITTNKHTKVCWTTAFTLCRGTAWRGPRLCCSCSSYTPI